MLRVGSTTIAGAVRRALACPYPDDSGTNTPPTCVPSPPLCSGAVGVGCQRLRLATRPDSLAAKQALAAVGQVHLMRYYDDLFSAIDMVGPGRGRRAGAGVGRLTFRKGCFSPDMYSAVQFSSVQFSSVQFSSVQCSACFLRVLLSCRRRRSLRVAPLLPRTPAEVRPGAADAGQPGQPQPVHQRQEHL